MPAESLHETDAQQILLDNSVDLIDGDLDLGKARVAELHADDNEDRHHHNGSQQNGAEPDTERDGEDDASDAGDGRLDKDRISR